MSHPEFDSEQAYINAAYEYLELMRDTARQLKTLIEPDSGGTHQARLERDVTQERGMTRLARLTLGHESLVFGRIDHLGTQGPDTGERFYIGRLPVYDKDQNSLVIDWRAPVAEPFYRATGVNTFGLERRRHFATEEDRLLGIDDEVFDLNRLESQKSGLVGTGALLAALGRSRTSHMRDIVATIQTEQDEIIRAPLAGVVVVQGGPGTGKTAVALHRASYLLYTHRFPLERQGVLVVGPNRVFIRYISRVLPALGETGVELAGIDDLYGIVKATGKEAHVVERVKGDPRMSKVLRRAVSTRQRGLKETLEIGLGLLVLKLSGVEITEIVNQVKRGNRVHNASRKILAHEILDRFYSEYTNAMERQGIEPGSDALMTYETVSMQIRKTPAFKMALERMWPKLSAQELLRDLYGAKALIKAASQDVLTPAEQVLLERNRGESVESVSWTSADIALLDEAEQLLGPLPSKVKAYGPDGQPVKPEGIRTFGHIVIDEAQDLSPMQLRMVARRSLGASLTVVGDIGQATGVWAPKNWEQLVSYLPSKRPCRSYELTVGYRTPKEVMDVAGEILAVATPELVAPTSVRSVGYYPVAKFGSVTDCTVQAIEEMRELIGNGTIGVLMPSSLTQDLTDLLKEHHIGDHSLGDATGGVTLLEVKAAKGLEFDGVIVVEPSDVVAESAHGLRSLYIALTRTTSGLAIVHSKPLPESLENALVRAANESANG